MRCDEAHRLIDLALDDAAELEGKVLEHLTGCARCRERHESGRELVGLLEGEARLLLAPVPRVSAESVLRRVDGRARRTRRLHLERSLVAAAAALLIGLAVALVTPAPRARGELAEDEVAALEELREVRDDLLGSLWGDAARSDARRTFHPLVPNGPLAAELDSLGAEVRKAEAFLLGLLSLSEFIDRG